MLSELLRYKKINVKVTLLKVNSQKLPLPHAWTASSILQHPDQEKHSPKTYPQHPAYDLLLQKLLLLPAKWTAILRKADETPEINSRSQRSMPMVKETTYPNTKHLFMPTAERLLAFMNLAVTQSTFTARIYRQVLGVDLLKDLCNVSHTCNCMQGLYKYPKPSSCLKLLFHFLKSTLKGTLSSFLIHETHNECKNYFCSILRKISCPHSAPVFLTLKPLCLQISKSHGYLVLQNGWH